MTWGANTPRVAAAMPEEQSNEEWDDTVLEHVYVGAIAELNALERRFRTQLDAVMRLQAEIDRRSLRRSAA
ncbi:MAG: hypothetical protein JO227_20810 [Acetobacteraceae bacterium]|nr:hypothetical protein [Acetobacteraceae bacterium]